MIYVPFSVIVPRHPVGKFRLKVMAQFIHCAADEILS